MLTIHALDPKKVLHTHTSTALAVDLSKNGYSLAASGVISIIKCNSTELRLATAMQCFWVRRKEAARHQTHIYLTVFLSIIAVHRVKCAYLEWQHAICRSTACRWPQHPLLSTPCILQSSQDMRCAQTTKQCTQCCRPRAYINQAYNTSHNQCAYLEWQQALCRSTACR